MDGKLTIITESKHDRIHYLKMEKIKPTQPPRVPQLGQLAAHIVSILKTVGYIPKADLMTFIENYYGGVTFGKGKNIRRRVYDVLNILQAVDFIKKNSTVVEIIETPNYKVMSMPQISALGELEERKQRIKELEKEIYTQGKLLLLYYSLIYRNFEYLKPPHSVHFPFMVIGFPVNQQTQINKSRGGERVTLKIEGQPKFLSVNEILLSIGLDITRSRNYIRSSMALAGLEAILFDRTGNLRDT